MCVDPHGDRTNRTADDATHELVGERRVERRGVARFAASGGDPTGASSPLALEDVADLVCRGGWPVAVGLPRRTLTGPSREYVEAVAESDVSRVDGTLRDPERVRLLLRSLARLQGTQSSVAVICADMSQNDSSSLNAETVYQYISALRKIFVIEDMPAWCPNLRFKTPVRTSVTRYFTDPSIGTAALNVGPGNLMDDLASFGLLFESLAVRDLRVYAEASGAHVSHYHDKSGLECDAIVHWDSGEFGLIEIKLGGEALVEKGVATLNALSQKLATAKPAAFKMVLVGDGDFAYRRKDGIVVCPLGALCP